MRLLSFPEPATPAELRAQVIRLQDEAWPAAGPPVGHDPALRPLSMLLLDGDTVLSALDILFKDIEHAGQRYRAGGLSTVVTSQAVRRHGYGRQLVSAARERMHAMALDLGVFTCDRPLQSFYESAGWQLLAGTVLVGGTPDTPFPSDQPGFDKLTIGCFFSTMALQHQQSFRSARIELYPGLIDKLW
ncbi:MAG TPA: GNAT family N-acetyltransferase [Jatrophihabitans sp.]|nr:GNAT family N-acetyltransferase [Jatrophihabitans sp.]